MTQFATVGGRDDLIHKFIGDSIRLVAVQQDSRVKIDPIGLFSASRLLVKIFIFGTHDFIFADSNIF